MQEESKDILKVREVFISMLIPVYFVIITGLPLTVLIALRSIIEQTIFLYISPLLIPLYLFLYTTTAIILSFFSRHKSVAGKFPRNLGHSIYGPRRLYAFCWTSIYYFTPLYHIILAYKPFKKYVLRGFGYKGSIDITLYPDTWLRDINLLNIESGVYLSNKATIGTNMCLKDGDIMVLPITLKKGVLIGHLAMIAPGVVLGEDVEIGVGTSIGVKTKIGKDSKIGPASVIHHGVRIGKNVDIGTRVYIGNNSIIADNIRIPSTCVIPNGVKIRNEEELLMYISSGTIINKI